MIMRAINGIHATRISFDPCMKRRIIIIIKMTSNKLNYEKNANN